MRWRQRCGLRSRRSPQIACYRELRREEARELAPPRADEREPEDFDFDREPDDFAFEREPDDFDFEREPAAFVLLPDRFERDADVFSFDRVPVDFVLELRVLELRVFELRVFVPLLFDELLFVFERELVDLDFEREPADFDFVPLLFRFEPEPLDVAEPERAAERARAGIERDSPPTPANASSASKEASSASKDASSIGAVSVGSPLLARLPIEASSSVCNDPVEEDVVASSLPAFSSTDAPSLHGPAMLDELVSSRAPVPLQSSSVMRPPALDCACTVP